MTDTIEAVFTLCGGAILSHALATKLSIEGDEIILEHKGKRVGISAEERLWNATPCRMINLVKAKFTEVGARESKAETVQ